MYNNRTGLTPLPTATTTKLSHHKTEASIGFFANRVDSWRQGQPTVTSFTFDQSYVLHQRACKGEPPLKL